MFIFIFKVSFVSDGVREIDIIQFLLFLQTFEGLNKNIYGNKYLKIHLLWHFKMIGYLKLWICVHSLRNEDECTNLIVLQKMATKLLEDNFKRFKRWRVWLNRSSPQPVIDLVLWGTPVFTLTSGWIVGLGPHGEIGRNTWIIC